jgi:hypothetical protein
VAAGEVDDNGLEVEDGGGVLRVRNEAAVCSEAREEAAAYSGAGIKDGRRRQHDVV